MRDEPSVNNTLTLVFQYADSSTRNYVMEDVPQSAVGNIKNTILAINANENGTYAAFYATFVSSNGSAVSSILNTTKLVTVEEEVIYNG